MAAPMTSNVTDLCRLCGTDTLSIVRHPIFEADGVSRRLANKITECLPVVVTEQDRLPKIMCGECVYKLDLLSEFRNNVVKTEHLLESLVDGVKPEIIENEEHDDDFGADDDFRSSSPELEQNEPEVLIKEEEALPVKRPRRAAAAAAAAAKKPGKRGRKRKQTEGVADEAPTKAAKRSVDDEQLPEKPREPKKRGRKPKDHKESAGWVATAGGVAAEEQRAKTPPGSVRCPHCNECFGGRERLTLHVRRECAARAFICETCGKHVRSVKALARHRVVHYPKKLECDFCHRTFHHKETIAKHVRTHMSVRPYQCAYCAKAFKHANILNDHVNVVHLGILKDAFPCVACPRSFCRRSHLERHMRTHTGERPYECDTCGAKFASSYNMRAHRASVHKIMPHLCSICAVGVRTRQALADHCLQMHDLYI